MSIKIRAFLGSDEDSELHGWAKWSRVLAAFAPILIVGFVAGYATCLAVTYLTVGAP